MSRDRKVLEHEFQCELRVDELDEDRVYIVEGPEKEI